MPDPAMQFHLLASGDADIGKFIFGGIFALIWIASAIGSAMKKRAEQERFARVTRVEPAPTPQLAEAIRQRVAPVVVTKVIAPVAKRPPKMVRKRGKVVPPPLQTPAPIIPVAAPVIAPAPVVPASRPTTVPAINAPQIRRWLTPATLRQQFMLTEILRPPIALRDDDV